jgi:hypothetical protein
MDKDVKGSIAELRVLTDVVRSGRIALLPHGGKAKYDLLIDNGDSTFTKVQVKSGWRKGGYLIFKATRNSGNRKRVAESYVGHADVFAVYDDSVDKVYWMKVFESTGDRWLRLDTIEQYSEPIWS